MIPNIYESPSESLNLQLQKPGFLREERVKTPQGCWGKKKKLNQLSRQHFQAAVELLGSSK